jgi:predicted nucleic acid-binding Zn ribbon protein
MRRRRSEPEALGALVPRVLDDLGLDGPVRVLRVVERWEEAVGAEIAAHCQPVSLRNGTLEAVVDSSVWAQQLGLRVPEILEALRRVLGDEAPATLRFHVGPGPSPGRAVP